MALERLVPSLWWLSSLWEDISHRAETQQAWLVISQLYNIPEEHSTVKGAMCLQVKKAGPRTRDKSLNPGFVIYYFINLPGY